MSGIPDFRTVINGLIAEIAEERGEDPKEFKNAILAKIRTGAEVPASAHREAAKKPHTRGSLNE